MSALEKIAAGIGTLLHLLFGVFPFAASGLVVPVWGIVVLYAYWLALAVVLVRLLRGPARRPMLAPVVPFAALAGWFAFVTAGEAVFGWTA